MATNMNRTRTIRFAVGIAAACAIAATATAGPHDEHKHGQDKVSNAQNIYELVSQDGTNKYEIEINGEDVTARVNGLRVTGDRIKQVDGMVMILDDSGDVVKEFSIAPSQSGGIFRGKVRGNVRTGDNQSDFRFFRGNDGPSDVVATVGHPPVMLGVLLDSPGEALRAQLGVSEHAILLEKVMDDLPAEKAGLRQWDIVVAIDGKEIDNSRALLEILMDSEDGDEIELTIIRSGKKIERTLELESYDAGRLGHVTANVTIEADGDQNEFPFGLQLRNRGQESANLAIAEAMKKLGALGANSEDAKREIERLTRELSQNSSQWSRQGNLLTRKGRMFLDNKGRLLELDDADRDELEGRFEELEEQFDERLEELEDRLESHWDKMEEVFDRMFNKVERLLEESRD